MSKTLYTYGTLRPGKGEEIRVKGDMYNLGWFPGVILGGVNEFTVEKIEVDDWDAINRYEGYREDDPEGSLYIRRPFLDGFIYEYNRPVDPATRIESGDWLEARQERKGRYGGGRFR